MSRRKIKAPRKKRRQMRRRIRIRRRGDVKEATGVEERRIGAGEEMSRRKIRKKKEKEDGERD
jgi:hypothetical protein